MAIIKHAGIQTKILVLLFCILFFGALIGAVGLLGITEVKEISDSIIEENIPLLRSIEEALSAVTIGQLALEKGLDVDSPNELNLIDSESRVLDAAALRFGMFMSAITWGTESEAFQKTNGGKYFVSWQESGLSHVLIVPQGTPAEVQLAGQTNIYFGGFLNHAQKAIDLRKQYLKHIAAGDLRLADEVKDESKEEVRRARVFADDVVKNLRRMVQVASVSVDTQAKNITRAQESSRNKTIIIGLSGFVISILVAVLFARGVLISPLRQLVEVARGLGAGNLSVRAKIRTGDELEFLGRQFNEMAEHLFIYTRGLEERVQDRTRELTEKIDSLNELNRKLDQNSLLLLKRDVELTKANEKLTELDWMKSEFLSVAAHQLRTPLSAIKWVMSVLLEDRNRTLSDEQRSYIMKGEESNNRMIRLVDDMLTVTRIESGKTEYHYYPIELRDALSSVVNDLKPKAASLNITLTLEVEVEGKTTVTVDPEKIRLVFENLIDNAIKYTRKDGTVKIVLAVDGENLKTVIRDSGIGIPEAEQKNIFTKFFRATNASKQTAEGTGLGLYVAKTIIEYHGGSISFTSSPGNGSEFVVLLRKDIPPNNL